MSFEHPNRNNESMIDVERDIMSRPSERNTTNLDLQRMKMILDIMGHPEQSFRVIHITGTNGKGSSASPSTDSSFPTMISLIPGIKSKTL